MRFYPDKLIFILLMLMAGCTSTQKQGLDEQTIDRSLLPPPDLTLSIPGLGTCTDDDKGRVQINSASPLTVLVHGCNGSAGRFRSLAQVYAFHGQQTLCFSYDDRDKLVDSAAKLADSIGQLSHLTKHANITILGHSMGGLISRKAFEIDFNQVDKQAGTSLDLITVSAPFAGIEAANTCGIEPLHWLSLGVVPTICWIITGDNWFEITASSNFIQQPGGLLPIVERHLKVSTDETGACRRINSDGQCIESDDIFNLSEQYQPLVDNHPNVVDVQVDAGHVEIVGYKSVPPKKLISVLQQYGYISQTPRESIGRLEQLLADLY